MPQSRLPAGGTNLFQEIKERCLEAEGRGQTLYRLSIGQPAGSALLSAREAAAKAVMSGKESMHEYQDNDSPGVPDFARRLVQAFFKVDLFEFDLAYLPTPGTKSMLGLIPLACGAAQKHIVVGTTTRPGYPTPADWCDYLGTRSYPLKLGMGNKFRFGQEDILPGTDLLMVNYPHNPSGQVATLEWWEKICRYCARENIRLFNDNPYYALSHSSESHPLIEVARGFRDLSWAEACSVSKVIGNGTGWRVGAIVGSPDFVGDIGKIKGNTDSGFAAPMAAGALYAIEHDLAGTEEYRRKYGHRIEILKAILTECGMWLAVEPGAGFFTLWEAPKMAFGKRVESAREFNFLMIEQTGVVGVHFNPYIRYSVTGDIEGMAGSIAHAFSEARVSY